MTKKTPPPLLSTRAAVVLLLGLLCGFTVSALTYFAAPALPAAVLAGFTAAGGAIVALNKAIG